MAVTRLSLYRWAYSVTSWFPLLGVHLLRYVHGHQAVAIPLRLLFRPALSIRGQYRLLSSVINPTCHEIRILDCKWLGIISCFTKHLRWCWPGAFLDSTNLARFSDPWTPLSASTTITQFIANIFKGNLPFEVESIYISRGSSEVIEVICGRIIIWQSVNSGVRYELQRWLKTCHRAAFDV